MSFRAARLFPQCSPTFFPQCWENTTPQGGKVEPLPPVGGTSTRSLRPLGGYWGRISAPWSVLSTQRMRLQCRRSLVQYPPLLRRTSSRQRGGALKRGGFVLHAPRKKARKKERRKERKNKKGKKEGKKGRKKESKRKIKKGK